MSPTATRQPDPTCLTDADYTESVFARPSLRLTDVEQITPGEIAPDRAPGPGIGKSSPIVSRQMGGAVAGFFLKRFPQAPTSGTDNVPRTP